MPDLSQPQGGFGAGESASDETFFIAVLEEWADCTVRSGHSACANSLPDSQFPLTGLSR